MDIFNLQTLFNSQNEHGLDVILCIWAFIFGKLHSQSIAVHIFNRNHSINREMCKLSTRTIKLLQKIELL